MIIQVEINDVLVSDLASFQGKETLTEEELSQLVYQTIVDKAAQFVQLNADAKLAQAQQQIAQYATSRTEEIASGISVTAQ